MELLKLLPAVLISGCLSAELPFGLVGGQDLSGPQPPYAAYVASSGNVTSLPIGLTNGIILSVAMNATGNGIIGGHDLTIPQPPYAALVTPSGSVTPCPTGVTTGNITSVALNNFNQGLIGGRDTSGSLFYAATVSPSGTVTRLPTSGNGTIQSVALNDSGQGLIGGATTGSVAYTARVIPPGSVITIPTPVTLRAITSVAINASGNGIIGGNFSTGDPAYFALVSSSGTVQLLSSPPLGADLVAGVAINNNGQGIIGASGGALTISFAALVSPSGVVTPVPLSIPTGDLRDVAINADGKAIVGGFLSPTPYAAFISPSGVETVITTGFANGLIQTVAINAMGQGLIGGQDQGSGQSYVAIVSPSGMATRLNLGVTTGIILSTAILPILSVLPLLSAIPTGSLSGNNLAFANYINQYAPQDAFYFVPSVLDGTLAQALESAAPTRNALSLYTSMNNLFYLNNRLSGHLRNASDFRTLDRTHRKPDELTASVSNNTMRVQQHRPHTLWFDGIGACSYQKPQKQTVGFNPTTGAALLGFDTVIHPKSWIGAGAAYSYTQIHEKKHAGHSHINQEYLFVYGSDQRSSFYLDGALWGGLFQISQVRNISMTGFTFKSTSHPHGWQLSPHLEFGYHPYTARCFTTNPFVMIDWANSWQKKYKEKGSGPFNAEQKKHYSSMLRTELGSRFYQTVSYDTWRLTFQEKCSYVYKKPFRVGRVNAFLVGSPGTFTVETLTTPQNLGVAEFGMIFEPTCPRHPDATLAYQGEFGASYQSHQVSLELAWNF